MAPKIFNIATLTFLILLEALTLHVKKTHSQNKYDFEFETDWNWEDLLNKAVLVNPDLIRSIGQLKKEISIQDARLILRNLSELSSLQELSELQKAAESDSEEDGMKWDSLITKSFLSMGETDDLGGLISVLMKLTKLRKENNENLFKFTENNYLSQPIKENKKTIRINFDYSGADKVLEYYNKGEEVIKEILNVPVYTAILNDKNPGEFSEAELENFLKESSNNGYLETIYKWVNPGSFWNLGGVSIYKSNLARVLNTLKQNERNMKTDIENHVSEYLPDGVSFKSDIMFLYGKKNPGWLSENKNLGIDLEYFGDNYKYLTRYIQHRIFKIAQKEIQLPVDLYVVRSHDRDFVRLLSNILENGTANYIGPIGTETRPWYLLEKDFALFNNTFRSLYSAKDRRKTDSLLNAGYSGDAPFYTMGTQMAYIIETTIGRNALIEAIKSGPVFFFNRYIEVCKEYPDKIRGVFTFSEKLEEKIASMNMLFPGDVINDALDLKKYRNDTSAMNKRISQFMETYKDIDNQNLLYLLSGQLFLEAGEFENAKESFLKGISSRKNTGELAGEIAESFLNHSAPGEALDFYNFYVEHSPEDARAFEERGKFYFKTGDNEKAKNDFEKALVMNSQLKEAMTFLKKINSN